MFPKLKSLCNLMLIQDVDEYESVPERNLCYLDELRYKGMK